MPADSNPPSHDARPGEGNRRAGRQRRARAVNDDVGRTQIPPPKSGEGLRRKLNGKQIAADGSVSRPPRPSAPVAPSPPSQATEVTAELGRIVAALQKLTDAGEAPAEEPRRVPPPLGSAAGVVASEAPKRIERAEKQAEAPDEGRRLPFKTMDYSAETAEGAAEANYGPEWGGGAVVAVDEVRRGSRGVNLMIFLIVCLLGFLLVHRFIIPNFRAGAEEETTPEAGAELELAAAHAGAETTIRAFLEASDIRTKATHIRFGAQLLPTMADYYLRHEDEPALLEKLEGGEWIEVEGVDFYQARLDYGSTRGALATFEKVDDRYLLDWKSFVAYGDLSWPEFVSRRPEEAQTMRVHVEKVDRYEGSYDDPARFLALRLTDARRSADVMAYYPTVGLEGDRVRTRFDTLMQGRRERATVSVSFAADADGGRTARVERFLRFDWLDIPPAEAR